MDWIDPRYSSGLHDDERTNELDDPQLQNLAPTGKRKLKKSKNKAGAKNRGGKRSSIEKRSKTSKRLMGRALQAQVSAALAQPLDVWAAAFGHALGALRWPTSSSAATSFMFSSIIQEQAEVLVRAGMSATDLGSKLTDDPRAENPAAHVADVSGLMDQSLESVAFLWLDACDAFPYAALGTAAIAWHIPEHADRSGNHWLTQWIQAVIDRIATYRPSDDESVLCHLVMQCELPLLIAIATAASKRAVLSEASVAMDNLAEHLEKGLDAPSAWLAYGATYLRAALASVFRCRVLADTMGLRNWYPPQQEALAKLLIHAARWSRSDGTQLLCTGNLAAQDNVIWGALVKQAQKSRRLSTVTRVAGLVHKPGAKLKLKKLRQKELPTASYYCEPASGACMMSQWGRKEGRLAVDFSDTEICIEAIGPKGIPILQGNWTANVELDGQAQLQLDQWDEVCWFSDSDIDYLEMEARFGSSARVQRQAILFREQPMIMLADALLCDMPGNWSLNSRIATGDGVSFATCPKNTEGYLNTTDAARCLTLPLFMPEWKRQPASGSVTYDENHLIVRGQVAENTQRMYLPVLISLCNRQSKKEFTWRRLTVAEDLRIVRADEAVAFRVQIGKKQWLLYRSLAKPTRRTAVGVHTLADFFAGRFDADDGEVTTLVEVDASS